ncbi:type II toxin-antitoxin system PemK/MazF family toxin [Microbacterium sp. B2969]|uniref:Type II toxin-antitoxin system PemK/MazF family toxin n=1 Tax=Microbacterium alkaliflavum TaxID=3248839 RepID=A0ABW7Q4V2_9MICO
MTPRRGFLGALKSLLTPPSRKAATPEAHQEGRAGVAATIEIEPPAANALRITYAPDPDGDPDAGEIIWTWVPYAERDGRGKDRPVLVIGRESDSRVYAVRLTSKSHDGDRDFLGIGSGPWDSQGRPSWIDIEQLYSVHTDGMRREASALDLDRFTRVAAALHDRYGWAVGDR